MKALGTVSNERCSTEDQAILEEAYKRDPKPDKAARLELVRQVALGEKEVQVGSCTNTSSRVDLTVSNTRRQRFGSRTVARVRAERPDHFCLMR